ncbi:MAG TPA: pentapeptide repeat-containing protein [Candidatus Limnocylindrales bacterium]|nr:pentapeptide repeat-containing protein [Candidatus Limnocylindrales bacterium]
MELKADCARCFGLCCVVPAFSRSADFAIDKPAGKACPNLREDFACGIHNRLRSKGFSGCTTYDCFGAGQQVARVTFGGRDWRSSPALREPMFAVFPVMGRLHELLYYLTEALSVPAASPMRAEVQAAIDEIAPLTGLDADALLALDLQPYWKLTDELLTRVSSRARAGLRGLDRRGADLIGANLRGQDLRGANLRGARLIRADLRDADLRLADMIGADLRGADLRGADLTGALFLTRSQLAAVTLGACEATREHWQ